MIYKRGKGVGVAVVCHLLLRVLVHVVVLVHSALLLSSAISLACCSSLSRKIFVMQQIGDLANLSVRGPV